MRLGVVGHNPMSTQMLWDALLEGLRKDGRAALATVVETSGSVPRHAGAKMVVLADGSTVGTVGGGSVEAAVSKAAMEALRDQKPRLIRMELEEGDSVCGGQISVFVDPVVESPLLLMVGAGHVGAAVAEVATAAGFRVVLLDDRREIVQSTVARTGTGGIVGPISRLLRALRLSGSHHVVIATRGHSHDEEALRSVLAKNVGYLGMIGSAAKVRHVIGNLRAEGVAKEALDRVSTPVGLDIGAETPGEIAVAIVAEMIMHLRGGSGRSLREVKGWRLQTCERKPKNAKCKVQNERGRQAGERGRKANPKSQSAKRKTARSRDKGPKPGAGEPTDS